MSHEASPSTLLNPPKSLSKKLTFLGPGFILSASIVGSGELIATTLLGAKAGFIALWVILLSCFVKVAIQVEFGKNAILFGKSLMTEINQLSDKKSTFSNWSIWGIGILTLLKILQLGGMIGGAALALSLIFPSISVGTSLVFLGAILPFFFLKNYYPLIERTASIMVFAFSLFTLFCFLSILFTPYSFNWEQIRSGLSFHLPKEYLFVAIGAFGITGVASDEIIAYTYWCREKGYAKYTGPNDGSDDWKKRAQGWINIMKLDAAVAMIIYTLITAAFYILGASVLYENKNLPEGNDLISYLASIYTETLGEEVKTVYLVGAFFALYSSVFATLAYWTRLFPDILGTLGWISESNKIYLIQTLAIFFPIAWIAVYWFIQQPAFLVLIGGSIGSVLLIIISYLGIVFHRKNKTTGVDSGVISALFFWISLVSILGVSLYGIVQSIQ